RPHGTVGSQRPFGVGGRVYRILLVDISDDPVVGGHKVVNRLSGLGRVRSYGQLHSRVWIGAGQIQRDPGNGSGDGIAVAVEVDPVNRESRIGPASGGLKRQVGGGIGHGGQDSGVIGKCQGSGGTFGCASKCQMVSARILDHIGADPPVVRGALLVDVAGQGVERVIAACSDRDV